MPRDSLTQNLETLRIDQESRGGGSSRFSKLLGYAAAALALGLIVVLAVSLARTTTVEVARVVSLEVREPSAVLVAGGYAVAHHKIQLSSKVAGKVAWIGVEKGQAVEQGQVLVRLEDNEYRAAVEQAAGNLAAAAARLRQLETGSRPEEIQQARGALNYAQSQLDATLIRSPVRGTVLERLVEKGEMVTTMFVGDRGAKSSVVTLADLKDLQVELDINQNDFARIKPQQACSVVADAYPDRRYRCVVDEIAPEANRQKATVQVKVKVLDPDGLLRPEMNARVSFHAPGGGEVKGTELLVPRAAIFQAGDKPAVMAVENSHAALKPVSLGEAVGENVRVTGGLTGNETVVVSSPGALKNGQRVRVR